MKKYTFILASLALLMAENTFADEQVKPSSETEVKTVVVSQTAEPSQANQPAQSVLQEQEVAEQAASGISQENGSQVIQKGENSSNSTSTAASETSETKPAEQETETVTTTVTDTKPAVESSTSSTPAQEDSSSSSAPATPRTEQAPKEDVKKEGDEAVLRSAKPVPMYRLYNPNSGEHFYTASLGERNSLATIGWKYEGGAWLAPESGDGNPVYRLYNPNAGDHHYTTNAAERDHLIKVGWKYENIGWYSSGQSVVYRLYNPNAKAAGAHHYTMNKAEYDHLIRLGWRGEQVAWYALGNFDSSYDTPVPSNVQPRKVDENITGAGGAEKSLKGSYRLLYSNKAFDSLPSSYKTPFLEFSADVIMTGSSSDYGMQFIIAGNGGASGQVGLDIGFQAGSSADFAQNRIAIKTVNFPSNAGAYGQQFYSVNTQANMQNGKSAKIAVQYFKGQAGDYLVTKVNGSVVGTYKTSLTTPNAYILHAQITDTKGKASLKLSNVKVKKNGVDVTSKGAPSLKLSGNGANLTANTTNWLINGAYY